MKDDYLNDICGLKADLIRSLMSHFNMGLDKVDTDEAGKVVDMIKDLAEAEYYISVVEAMDRPNKSKGSWTQGGEDTQNTGSKHGQIFDDYMKYKRYYTETKSPSQKDEMDAKANEYVGETVSTIRDIWRDADPEMRRKLKAEFVKLVNEMNI